MKSLIKVFLFAFLLLTIQAFNVSDLSKIRMYEEDFVGLENAHPFILIGMKEIISDFEQFHTLSKDFIDKKSDPKFIVSLFFAEAQIETYKDKRFENSLFLYYDSNCEFLILDLYYKGLEYTFNESSLLKYTDYSTDTTK